jgi:nickel-dependent lactate racemase
MERLEVTVPSLEWHGDEPLTLSFPAEWEVKRCRMACEGHPGMSEDEIRAAISDPIGTPNLENLAGKAKEVVIIIDDMTRPTKSHQYAASILETIHGAGIPRDNVRFIIAPGTHGTFGRLDFVKKLGEEIVDEYQCYNHNPYEMLDYLGETSYGTPVYVNSEVMRCDLKIGVGTALFHRLMGMSGGGKIISPGVVGMETIRHNHGFLGGFGPDMTPPMRPRDTCVTRGT